MAETRTPSRPDHPGIIAPPPLIYIGVLASALFLDWALGGPGLGLPYGPRMTAGAVLMIAGAAMDVAGGSRFMAAKTNIHPWKPATAIVTSGIYRFTRNPVYLGMGLIYIALSLLADSLIALALIPVALVLMHYGVIAREERYLEAKFGEPYRAYKRQVRRWL